jgi:hypothetical protein
MTVATWASKGALYNICMTMKLTTVWWRPQRLPRAQQRQTSPWLWCLRMRDVHMCISWMCISGMCTYAYRRCAHVHICIVDIVGGRSVGAPETSPAKNSSGLQFNFFHSLIASRSEEKIWCARDMLNLGVFSHYWRHRWCRCESP